ncbi:MAG: hypothetical protein RBS39_06750 [Phycisphaerales bacterium]|jgi:hypothetical protein|nr:hypothetical protein [Phycisphaerales bacterium]
MARRTIGALIAVVALVGVSGCSVQHYDPPTKGISNTNTDRPLEGDAVFGMPITIPGERVVIVPFVVEEQKYLFEDRDPYTRGGYASARMVTAAPLERRVRWHNAVFHDLASGEQWPLLQRRGVVASMAMLGAYNVQDREPETHGLCFIATMEDTDDNKVLNDRDAAVAIVTDAQGRGARMVMPANVQILSQRYDPTLRALFFDVLRDTNANGTFDNGDLSEPWVYELGSDGPAHAIVGSAMEERVRGLVGRTEASQAAQRAAK